MYAQIKEKDKTKCNHKDISTKREEICSESKKEKVL
jgi:hypothetical protein